MIQHQPVDRTKLKDSYLRALLLDKGREHAQLLEDLLACESEKLAQLKKLNAEGKIEYGPKATKKDLEEAFSEVKSHVDQFLGVGETISPPVARYFNYFRYEGLPVVGVYAIAIAYFLNAFELAPREAGSSFDAVKLQMHFLDFITGLFCSHMGGIYGKICKAASKYCIGIDEIAIAHGAKKKELYYHVAHEYAHHVQQKTVHPPYLDGNIFREGHAKGVEKQIAKLYAEKTGDESFLYDITGITVRELGAAHMWICKKKGITPKSPFDKQKSLLRPSSHALGNALFSIYEAKYGLRIYRDVLNGAFTFT